jgi:hypothetical protein
MSGDENLWYVKTADGDVHRVTLDQLDEAFQAGRIDENVMVLPTGATRWAKLADLAGLDEPPPPAPVARAAYMPTPVASSLRPVSIDLSADLDENLFRKKSRKGVVVGFMLVILAGLGGALFMNRSHLHLSGDTAAAAAVIPMPDPPPAVAAVPDPPPAPAIPAASASADPNASKLSDDQKAKLAAADKALELKSKAHKKGHGAASGGSTSHGGKSKAQGFTTGGNKFDPLNASF